MLQINPNVVAVRQCANLPNNTENFLGVQKTFLGYNRLLSGYKKKKVDKKTNIKNYNDTKICFGKKVVL